MAQIVSKLPANIYLWEEKIICVILPPTFLFYFASYVISYVLSRLRDLSAYDELFVDTYLCKNCAEYKLLLTGISRVKKE